MYCISNLFAIPIRKGPSKHTEMMSQLLFGEVAEILKIGNKWLFVKALNEELSGYVSKNQINFIPKKEANQVINNYALSLELVYNTFSDEHSLILPFAARLPLFDGISYYINSQKFTFSGVALDPTKTKPKFSFLEKLARKLLNSPDLLGGRSPMGIDASGYIQVLFSFFGLNLFRTYKNQLAQGETIDFFDQANSGDVLYFQNKTKTINHAAIYLGNNEVIHVDGKVKFDKVDHFGIYDINKKLYTHKLRTIKRFISFESLEISSFYLESSEEKPQNDVNQQSLF